jgi:hypothetical protein
MKAFWSWAAVTWCRTMHPDPMWPVKGHYQCPPCLRRYPVPWEAHVSTAPAALREAGLSERPAAMIAAVSR